MARLINPEALAIATIWMEARGEGMDGMICVGEVIRNRMRRRYQSDGTIEGTVLRPYQFSGFNTRDANRTPALRLESDDPVVIQCGSAWQLSEETVMTRGAVLYYNPSIVTVRPPWVLASAEVAHVGKHHFFVPQDWQMA